MKNQQKGWRLWQWVPLWGGSVNRVVGSSSRRPTVLPRSRIILTFRSWCSELYSAPSSLMFRTAHCALNNHHWCGFGCTAPQKCERTQAPNCPITALSCTLSPVLYCTLCTILHSVHCAILHRVHFIALWYIQRCINKHCTVMLQYVLLPKMHHNAVFP